jgi:chaperonin GroES
MNLKPLADKIVIEKIEANKQTKSGLFIPDVAQEKPQIGIVIAVGEGVLEEIGTSAVRRHYVNIDDKVVFQKYGGTEITIDDKKFFIISQKDVLAVIED